MQHCKIIHVISLIWEVQITNDGFHNLILSIICNVYQSIRLNFGITFSAKLATINHRHYPYHHQMCTHFVWPTPLLPNKITDHGKQTQPIVDRIPRGYSETT